MKKVISMELVGNKKNIINCWLTDQDNVRLSTAGEDFSFRLVMYLKIKHIHETHKFVKQLNYSTEQLIRYFLIS